MDEFNVQLQAKLLEPQAKLPFRARDTDAGYDLYSIQDATLQPGRATIVRTGIAISAPAGYYYTIEGRSSLWIQGIFPNRGIIDATFCGELVVSLVNTRQESYRVKQGDRIAQLLLHRQLHAHFQLVQDFSDSYNQRGQLGFGSTGT